MWTISCNSYKNHIGWDYFYYFLKKFKKILLSLFLRTVLGLEQNVGVDIEISHIHFYPGICIASSISIPYKNHTFATTDELTFTHHNHPRSGFILWFILGAVPSMTLNKFIMTYIHHWDSPVSQQ